MNCASCGRANREGARYCGGCGAALAPRCPACGTEAAPDARFCDACGAPMAGRPAEPSVQRKVVTIVFADLIGSTALHERLDPESVRRIMEGYHGSVRAPVDAHGGTVVQLLGDGVMCAFGIPRVAEDDALRAVRAAVDVQRAFREFLDQHPELAGRVGLRVAVNTGEVVVSDDYAAGIGDPLNVAARLQQEARDGDVLIGGATQRFVADQVTLEPVGSFALKGRAEPVAAYRVVSLDPPERAKATPFVGRDAELRRLRAVYEDAVVAPEARLAVLLGSPGLGKSRLLTELAHRLGAGATLLTAQCVASVGATFAPLADALRSALDAAPHGDPAERARIESGVGALLAGTPAAPEETFFVVRRLLAALATKQPVVLVIDDLQWAEPLLLDLTEHLVQWGAGVPLLVLAAARPELREVRSSLTSAGGVVSEVVTLAGLDASAATQLAASLIGAEELPAAIAGRVLATSEGNPLFLGELVRMLVNDGALKRDGERWTVGVELAALDMPPTIQALLAARIERLRPEDRLVLERASVIGRQFSRAAVAHLLPQGALGDLDAKLESLRRSELVEPDTGWLLGEPLLRFHHSLIRDAAYRRLLRNARAELHTRFADWLEEKAGETALHEETLGWHLEQAHLHLREIGPLDANGRALGERAARYLASAGRRALARDDLASAGSLLGRALACLAVADPARAELALDWCEALLSAGDVVPAVRALQELERFAADSERLRAWHTCFSGQLAVLTDPQALRTSIEAVATAAETLAAAGDAAGEAKAYWVHAIALSRLGQVGPCEAALDRALAAARRVSGDRRRANAVLSGAPLAALWGPSPVTRASGRCLDVVRVLRITQGAPAVEAVALRCQGVLETLRGRAEAARRMLAASRRMVEELGITQRVLEADLFAGLIELLEGDAAGAERWLRTAYEGLRARGLGIDAAQAAALLGRALLAQGRAPEAEALSHESEALAGDDLKAAIAWRGVRAEALARRGEPEAALELARHAVEIAAATDALLDHADARQALAAALRAAGRNAEAAAEEQRAIELWEAKGATLLAERARRGAGGSAQRERPQSDAGERAATAMRRVRPNAVTAVAASLKAAVVARDAAALAALLADSYEMVDHPFGATYGHADALASFHALLRVRDPTFRFEPLATLGDSLALLRRRISSIGTGGGNLDVGAYEMDQIIVNEVEQPGCFSRGETFATDNLGDAIAHLYERYAELLPDGAERTRAAMTARAVAVLVGPLDVGATEPILAPDIEWVDQRRLGFEGTRGVAASLDNLRALTELSPDATRRIDDVLALEPSALLLRCTTVGTERAGGGAFERPLLALRIFGGDGRLVRREHFDADHTAEALARFDELTGSRGAAGAPSLRIRHPVRPNAATANAARMDAAILARDEAAIADVFAGDLETVHHPTGISYDRQGALDRFRSILGARGLVYEHEPLATLGDSLALFALRISYAGLVIDDLDVGAVEREDMIVIEVDARGKRRRSEIFASERLGNAITRLFERYAERMRAGVERTRAVATAHSVAALVGAPDLERWRKVFASDIEFIDARSVGFGSLRGADAVLDSIRALFELSSAFATRIEDVLGAEPGTLLVRWINSGTLRAGGGEFERDLCHVWRFGADGRLVRWEQFDAEDAGEALVRFDALAAPPRFRNFDRRRMVRLELDRDEHHQRLRAFFEVSRSRCTAGVIATRGDRLALIRMQWEGSEHSAGPSEMEFAAILEMGSDDAPEAIVQFDPDDLDAAYVELDARYAADEAAAHPRVFAATAAFRAAFARRDWEAVAAQYAPDVVVHDHRLLGWEPIHGAAAYVDSLRTLVELAPDVQIRSDHVAMNECGLLWVGRWIGSREGGPFDSPWIVVSEHDALGRVQRFDTYDLDQLDAARERFAELCLDPLRIPPNGATRLRDRVSEAVARREFDSLHALASADFRYEDRTRHSLVSGDIETYVSSLRTGAAAPGVRVECERVATHGERLALERVRYVGAAGEVEFEKDVFLRLTEVDSDERIRAAIHFDPEDRAAAFAEAQARFAAGEAAGSEAQAAITAFGDSFRHRDWAACHGCYTGDAVMQDHRRLGFGSVSIDGWIESWRVLVELAPDVSAEQFRILAWSERGRVSVLRQHGTREGGPFESVFVGVFLTRGDHIERYELFDLDGAERALARFAERSAG